MARLRVAVYVTRGRDLLVFTHKDSPESGVQVPAGGVRAGERLDAAARREVLEETGIAVSSITPLAVQTSNEDQLTVFVQATTATPLDRWVHNVSGTGEDAGMTFECAFVPFAKADLAGDQHEFLPLLH